MLLISPMTPPKTPPIEGAGETLIAFFEGIPCKSPYPIGASRGTPDHADDLGYRILYLDTPSGAHALPDGKCAGISMSIMVSCGKKTTLRLGNVAGEGTWALVHFRPWCRCA